MTYIQQLDERQRRLYCATRAINIGKHGVAAVCASMRISRNTIYRGIHELKNKATLPKKSVRVSGGGRKSILEEHPEYLSLFDEIVQNHMAGLPQDDSVRWLDLSVTQIKHQPFTECGEKATPHKHKHIVQQNVTPRFVRCAVKNR